MTLIQRRELKDQMISLLCRRFIYLILQSDHPDRVVKVRRYASKVIKVSKLLRHLFMHIKHLFHKSYFSLSGKPVSSY